MTSGAIPAQPDDTVDGSVRERLLAAATDLFGQRGYEAVPVQEIVEAAGVTKGALYHYVKTKSDLLFEICIRVTALQRRHLEYFAGLEAPAEVKLASAAANIAETTIENRLALRTVFRSVDQLGPAQAKHIQEKRREFHAMLRGMIEEGQAVGTFRSDIPNDLVVSLYMGGVRHLVTWFDPAGKLSGREAGEYYAATLISSLCSHLRPELIRYEEEPNATASGTTAGRARRGETR